MKRYKRVYRVYKITPFRNFLLRPAVELVTSNACSRSLKVKIIKRGKKTKCTFVKRYFADFFFVYCS